MQPASTTPDPRRRGVLVVAGVVLVAAVAVGVILVRGGDEQPTADLTIGFGGTEAHPSCVYDPRAQSVDCQITIGGTTPEPDTVTVTVTAYADENTSRPVGSSSRSVQVEGTMQMSLVLTIPVRKAPYVDVDGVAACRLSVD